MNRYSLSFLASIFSLGSMFASDCYAAPSACQNLTPVAFLNAITTMNNSLAQATLDFNKNGTGTWGYTAKYNRDSIVLARDGLVNLRTWLKANNLDLPYVTNASAAASVYTYARDAIVNLHYARHWASASAIYNSSNAARQSIDLTTNAINLLESLSAQGTVCYVDQYAPFIK